MSTTIDQQHLSDAITSGLRTAGENYSWLSKQVDTTPSVLSKMISGITKNPDLGLVRRICEVLDLSYREVIYISPLSFIEEEQDFSLILQRLIDESAMNTAEFSKKICFSKQYISRLLSGDNPSDAFCQSLAMMFGLSFDQIKGKSRINLEEASTFYFNSKMGVKQSYKYPLLSCKYITVLHEVVLEKISSKFLYEKAESYLGSKGYFYEVEESFFPQYFIGCKIGVVYPAEPKKGDHIVLYLIPLQKLELAVVADEGLYISLSTDEVVHDFLFRGVIRIKN